MADPVSLASLFDAAEQAAGRGDFAAAARLLGEAARAQEAALGPDHLDLANTLNNLAVAHERCGQLDAAEHEYRRAHAIAARTRPADDPLVTTSAQNLRDFCEANGRPVDVPPSAMSLALDSADPITIVLNTPPVVAASSHADMPTVRIEPLPMTLATEPEPAPAPKPRPRPAPVVSAPSATAPAPARATSTSPAAPVAPDTPRRRVSIPVLVAVGAIAAIVIWLLAGRGPATPPAETTAAASDAPAATPAPAPSTPPAAAPSDLPPTPAPTAPSPAAAPAPAPRAVPAAGPAPAAASADGVTIGDAQLCTSLSSSYRCDAAGSTVRPGRLVFYTRLIADRNTSVVHRWYRGNELRQSMRLDVPARRQGFRTFSRATVSASEGEWRVELRTRDGQILHTERFTVR